MLSYRQKKLSENIIFSKILAFSFGAHFLLILITFFISTIKKNGNVILINSSNKSSSVASISFAKKNKGVIVGSNYNHQSGKLISKNVLKKEKILNFNNEKSKIIKENILGKIKNNKKVSKPLVKKTPEIAVPIKSENKLKRNKKKLKTKVKVEQEPVQLNEEEKINEIVNDEKKISENKIEKIDNATISDKNFGDIKDEKLNTPDNSNSSADQNLVLNLENVDQFDILEKAVQEAILANYYVPPGFESGVKYVISFEITFDGKIRDISPRKDEPLALYTAIKQAILKAEFIRQKWGSRVELIY